MRNKKTVDEALMEKNVTLEEMEALSELIEECRERQRRIQRATLSLRENLYELFRVIEIMNERAEDLLVSLNNLNQEIETIYLLALPLEKIHRD